jgi:cyclomaltodextrinase
MTEIGDFFFSPFATAQEKRLKAAIADGLAHGSRIEPHDPQPQQPVTLLFSSDPLIDRVAIYYTTDESEPAGKYGCAENGIVVWAQPGEMLHDSGKSIRQWRAQLPGQPEGMLVRYRADGWSTHEPQRHCYADAIDPVSAAIADGRRFAYSVDRWTTPAWWHDALVYHIFVDRFNAAVGEPPMLQYGEREITDFFGGTLRGVIEKLDYIQALGANCIWLSPIFESPIYHGYNPSDYFNVSRRYGTNETLQQLVQEVHSRGMRILLDFVANHTSHEHAAFITAHKDPISPEAAWYTFDPAAKHGYRSYASVRDMPELNTDVPAVRSYLISAALHWLEHFGTDGLRLDYVPGPSHAFWTYFQKAIKEHHPQAYTIGEIPPPLSEIADYAGRMDGFMDFPLARMLRHTFATCHNTLAQLLQYLDERRPHLPPGMSRATLLDNHDMHRFLWLAGGKFERLKLAALCQLTLEGTPIIYYGTEVGLSQYADAHKENAHARAPMLWGAQQNADLHAYYRRLLSLRQSHTALRRGERTTVPTAVVDATEEASAQVGAYLRHLDGEYLLIALNNSEEPLRIQLALGAALEKAGITTTPPTLRNLLPAQEQQTDQIAIAHGHLELELPPISGTIYELLQLNPV